MDNLGIVEPKKGPSNPILRLVKTKMLNIIVIMVIIVCIILFMREGQTEDVKVFNIENKNGVAGVHIMEQNDRNNDVQPPPMPTTTNINVEDIDEQIKEHQKKMVDLTTTQLDMTTTPYFTTQPPRIHLKQNSEKQTYHIDYLKQGGYDVGNIKLDFLSNYRNPCFFEEREDTNVIHVGITYRYNPYKNREEFTDKFDSLKKMVIRSHDELCGSSAGCRLRCLPYFMVIGTAQSETIEFFDTLTLNKQVVPPIAQEVSFWHKYRFVDANFNDYLDLYDNATTIIHQQNVSDINTDEHMYLSVTGEAVPIAAITDPDWRLNKQNEDFEEPVHLLANDLYSVIPNLKFIFLMREPVTHMYWHYNNAPYGRDQKSPEDFHSRVKNSLEWWKTCIGQYPERACVYGTPPDMEEFENRAENSWWPKTSTFLGALRDVLYYFYVKDYLAVFPKENFLFVRSDDYLADPRQVLNEKVFPFLSLSPFRDSFHISQSAKELEKNITKEYQPMLSDTQQLLKEFFTPYNMKLSELLHDNRFLWKDITEPQYKPNARCCG